MSPTKRPHTTQQRRTAQGQRLLSLRRMRGWTQPQAAYHAEMPPSQYAHYEQGLCDPSVPVLRRLAEAFDTTSDYIIGLSEKE
jgi:transcriptional regulator with XRE-family HTH domain